MSQRRPQPDEYASFYRGYVDRVPETDVVSALETQLAETTRVLSTIHEARAGHRYAPGKWSIREIVGHIGDGERAFGYRLFAIARGEKASLPGFDEDPYVAAAHYDRWSLAELIDCFVLLRRSHLLLVRNLPEEAWDRRGIANGNEISVRGLAYAMVGHERHHLAVLRERYLGA